MSNKLNRALVCVSIMQLISVTMVLQSQARDLTDVLERGFVFRAPSGEFDFARGRIGSIADFSHVGRAVGPAFSAAVTQAVTQEFPLVSVTPAFIYRLNPTVDTFERLTGVPGPLFSERALTLGKGKLNFGVGYSHIDYSEINGTPLDNIRSPGLIAEFFRENQLIDRLPTGEDLFLLPLTASRVRTQIDLNAHVVVPTFRYGLTNQWDISFALPIVSTFLRVKNTTVRIGDLATFAAVGPEGDLQFVDRSGRPIQGDLLRFSRSQRRPDLLSREAGSSTGMGDLTLRTKYQFHQNEFGGAALGLNLQLPTGENENFHGTGETHLMSFLYFSQVFRERYEPHLNVGIDFNADDVDRSSLLYATGGTLRLGAKLGIMIDFLGRSEFGRLPIKLQPEDKVKGVLLDRAPKTCTVERPCFIKDDVFFSAFPIKIKRNDILNFSFGLRYALGSAGSVFFGGIIPLNDDGFRADFIPSGGIEYTF